MESTTDDETVVLVTGFGPFQDIKTNPSWQITSQLPAKLTNKGTTIRITTYPEPLKAAYHDIASTVPKLLEDVKPDIVLHVGLATERDFFAVERGAERDGYHQYPDVARRVFTKAESKKVWGKSPGRLDSGIDFEDLLGRWKKGIGGVERKGRDVDVDVRVSDDVGSFVCGFVYYVSLEGFWARGKEAKVVFLHVPPLSGEKGVERGLKVVISLIKALVECSTNK